MQSVSFVLTYLNLGSLSVQRLTTASVWSLEELFEMITSNESWSSLDKDSKVPSSKCALFKVGTTKEYFGIEFNLS
jgi:hypothetical protein